MILLSVAALSVAVAVAVGEGDRPHPDPLDPIHAFIEAACRLGRADLYRGFPGQGLEVIEAVLPLGTRSDVSPIDRAHLAIARGELEHYRASLAGTGQEGAIELLRTALAAAEASSDPSATADAADLLGLALYSQAFENGAFDAPLPHLDRALAIRRRIDDRRGIAETLFHLGLVHQNRSSATAADRKRAQELYREALPIARDGAFEVEQSYLERHIAAEEEIRGNLDAAQAGFARSLALRRQAKYTIYLAPALLALGSIHASKGERAEAGASYREALATAREIGAIRFVVRSHLALAELAEKQGDRETASAEARSALEAARAAGYGDGAKEAIAVVERLASPPPATTSGPSGASPRRRP